MPALDTARWTALRLEGEYTRDHWPGGMVEAEKAPRKTITDTEAAATHR